MANHKGGDKRNVRKPQNNTKKKKNARYFIRNIQGMIKEQYDRAQIGFIIGIVLFFMGLLSAIATISFISTGAADQSIISAETFGRILTGQPEVSNICKAQGAAWSNYIFNDLFGFGIFFMLLYVFSIGLRLMGVMRSVSFVKRFIFCMGLTIWTSILAGWLQSLYGADSALLWGGRHGLEWSALLTNAVGSVGLIFILLVTAIIFIVLYKKETIHFFRKLFGLRWVKTPSMPNFKRKPKANGEQDDNDDDTDFDIDTDISDEDDDEHATTSFHTPTADTTPSPRPYTPSTPSASGTASANKPAPTILGSSDNMIVEIAPETEMGDKNAISRTQVGPGVRLAHFHFPPLETLKNYDSGQEHNMAEIEENKKKIVSTLESFKLGVSFHKATIGPTVTLYEVIPDAGIKISRIRAMEDDIAMSLKSEGVRIIAPMPGKGTIGIEVPNSSPQTVSMRSVLSSKRFQDGKENMALPIAIGKTITNEAFIFDLAKMPHLLIAGATGQGKSVGLNALITSLLYSKRPEELKFVMVDPKMLEFSVYEGLKNHYLAKLPDVEHPIITDMSKVVPTLNSLCIEMDNRYQKLTEARVRNIKDYNDLVMSGKLSRIDGHDFMPYIVLIVDEYADLIMNTNGKEAEIPITRIAQKARAAGIHMVIATQRPSSDIITGVIKANFPARIAFKVFGQIDSRVILDSPGANQLIGRGDMLFYQGKDMLRLQCAFVDTPESEDIVENIERQEGFGMPYILPEYIADPEEGIKTFNPKEKDALFEEVARMVVSSQIGSTSNIQRRFNIGYNRAGRLMDQLEAAGIVSAQDGSKPREVLVMDQESLERLLASLN